MRFTLSRSFIQAMSFAVIGLLNTAVDFAVFVAMREWAGASLVAANAAAWLVAMSGSYVMNSYITFAAESGRQLGFRRYLAFAATGLVGLFANTLTLLACVTVMPELWAKVVATLVTFVVNFTLARRLVFRSRSMSEADPPSGEGRK
jgi:putative flippase GtrA